MGREHWEETKFETLGTFINGRAFKPTEWSTSGLPIIRIQNLNNSISNYNYCDFEVPAKYHVHNGDLLFAWSGTPGTSFGAHTWYGGHAVLNQHIFRIEERSDVIDKKFFMYLINSNLNEHIASAHGTAGLAHITKAKFEESVVSIPPLNEQKRIVEKLDAILPKVKNAKTRLEKISLILKKFRQSVLSAACSGRLTEDWRECKDLPEWDEQKLDDLFTVRTGLTPLRSNEAFFQNGDIPWVKTGEVKNSDIKRTEEFITQRALDETSIKLFPVNTILIAMYGEGKTRGSIGRLKIRATTNQACAALINEQMPLPTNQYVFYFLLSQYEEMRNIAVGGVRPNLNLDKVKNIVVPLPSLEEQQEIVRRVEKLFALADSLEAKYKKAIQRVEKIEQSVLAKAFKGELADPDPTDEPATELLNRILEEKARLESTKKPHSKRSGKTEIVVA